MMIDKVKPTNREDDFRDYEERDIDEGWPYADGTSGSQTTPGNGAYGQNAENFDESGNPGFETSGETAIDSDNGPDLFGDDSEGDTDDDAHEETISNALEERDIDISALEIKVRRGVVLLTGSVDTAQERHAIEALALRTAGIVKVRNQLTTSGVDGNIPADADE